MKAMNNENILVKVLKGPQKYSGGPPNQFLFVDATCDQERDFLSKVGNWIGGVFMIS